MSYTVSATDLKSIQFSEKNELNAVLQNIAVILSTPRGSVPLYRDFGLDWSFLDKPAPVAKVLMVAGTGGHPAVGAKGGGAGRIVFGGPGPSGRPDSNSGGGDQP